MSEEPDFLTQLEWLATQLDAPNNCGGRLVREAVQMLRELQEKHHGSEEAK